MIQANNEHGAEEGPPRQVVLVQNQGAKNADDGLPQKGRYNKNDRVSGGQLKEFVVQHPFKIGQPIRAGGVGQTAHVVDAVEEDREQGIHKEDDNERQRNEQKTKERQVINRQSVECKPWR